MKKLLFGLILLLTIVSANESKELKRAYETIIAQERIIQVQDKDIIEYKTKEKERLIFRVPFTTVGISKDHVTGFICGGLTVLILL